MTSYHETLERIALATGMSVYDAKRLIEGALAKVFGGPTFGAAREAVERWKSLSVRLDRNGYNVASLMPKAESGARSTSRRKRVRRRRRVRG